jgi:uncharacterized protein YjdB
LPTHLVSDPDRISFDVQSGSEPLKIYANFSDGAYLDVTGSSNLAYASSNPAIASVDSFGVVKPVSQGSAIITATYTAKGHNVSISVSVKIPKPTVSTSPHAFDFDSQNVGTAGTVTLDRTGSPSPLVNQLQFSNPLN